MGKNSKSKKSKRKADGIKHRSISTELLLIEVPMIAAFIIVVAVVIFTSARSGLIEEALANLENESQENANSIYAKISGLTNYYDGFTEMLEYCRFENDEELTEVGTEVLTGRFEETPTGAYIGLSNKDYIDFSGWVPDDDYDCTTRGWYEVGIKSDTMTLGDPYVDMNSGSMVVSMSRKIKLKDGREGAISSDVFLDSIANEVAEYKPGGTGHAMLFDRNIILATSLDGYNGTDASEHASDAFITAIAKDVDAGSTEVKEIKGNDGETYLVSFDSVPSTTWTMVSYVNKDDVLEDLNVLRNITIILVIIALVTSTIIIMLLVKRMITRPVNDLTKNIVSIADGDFSIEIEKGGNNEIGIMNNRMHDYVGRMRTTLGEMKDVTHLLSKEADNSKSASDTLNRQANEQSNSMEQIHQAMEGVAESVTELATNATELAQSVSEMTDQGDNTNETMSALLEKAKKGQQDMENVQTNMANISVSMTEMNEVVERVGKATEQINSIIDMINSISSQTNLLSLNASIEAARAGEAGRGFAVVADEIGGLAGESANATKEIAAIITDVTREIEDLSAKSSASVAEIAASSEAVSETGSTFAEIFNALDEAGATVRQMITQMTKVNDIATSVAAIAEEQSASTQEVTATVDSAANSAQNVADESKSVDESAVTVADSAAKIGEFVDTFKI